MIEKPILFNTEMVKKILEGKTQTRRVIKPQPKSKYCNGICLDSTGYVVFGNEEYQIAENRKPLYKIDDILWVRETWCELGELDLNDQVIADTQRYYYRASEEELSKYNIFLKNDEYFSDEPLWKPSIHMPKEAARIFLRVTNVKVERLQDITNYDAIKEGIKLQCNTCSVIELHGKCNYKNTRACKDKFKCLWNNTIKKQEIDTYGWEANPWVWVISFQRIDNYNYSMENN